MKKTDSFVITDQYIKHSQQWLKWLQYQETIVVVFPYLNDRPLRIQQFIESLNSTSNFNPIYYDPYTQMFDEYEDLSTYITNNQKLNKTSVLVITNGDYLFLPQNTKVLEIIQNYRTRNLGTFTTLIAFESNIKSLIGTPNPYELLFQNVDYYPLYNLEGSKDFIKFLATKWNTSISDKTIQDMAEECGGSFWLIKEAVRIYRDSALFEMHHPNLQSRLTTIAKTFSPEELKTLVTLSTKQPNSSTHDYLQKIGYITNDNKLSIPSLESYLSKTYTKKNNLVTVGDQIYFDSVNISMSLSKNENSILKGLMSKPNVTFDRDQIAQFIWQENSDERYSQWAIDQAIKRLRDKLVKMGLPSSTIKSIRGVGYECRD